MNTVPVAGLREYVCMRGGSSSDCRFARPDYSTLEQPDSGSVARCIVEPNAAFVLEKLLSYVTDTTMDRLVVT